MTNFKQRPWEEDKELYLGSVVRDEENRSEVNLVEEVEPTEVVNHQPSLSKENNIWLESR
jgi:hypothetical protein